LARFLGVDPSGIYVGSRTLPCGMAIVCEDSKRVTTPTTFSVLELTGSLSPEEAGELARTRPLADARGPGCGARGGIT
jgi:hypothetical protein